MLPVKRSVFGIRLLLCCIALAVIAMAALPGLAGQSAQDRARQGDALWKEGSYALAAEAYAKALEADPKLPDHAEIELRIAVAAFRAEQWDRAIEAVEAYVVRYKETDSEAAGQVWRGRIYRAAPHAGYQVGKKVYRGGNVPPSEGKEAPRYVQLQVEDAQKAIDALCRAKTLYERMRLARASGPNADSRLTEEIELNFDLIHLFTPADGGYYPRAAAGSNDDRAVDWAIDLTKPLDARWPFPKKVVYLYDQIPVLDAQRSSTDHHATVLAAFGKATFIMTLRRYGGWYSPFYSGRTVYRGGRSRTPIRLPDRIPYLAMDPIGILQDAVDKYPKDPEADRLAFTIAQWTDQQGDYVKTAERYAAFLRSYPNSRWVADAKAQLDAIYMPTLAVNAQGTARPGSRAVISVNTRNVKQVRLTAYRVHPEEVFGKAEYRLDNAVYRPAFSNFERHWVSPAGVTVRREKVAEWTIATSDNGLHKNNSDSVPTPLDTLGAYLIEARAGDRDQLQSTSLAFVSDISLVQKVDRDSTLLYVADAATGTPVENAKFLIWAQRHYYGDRPNYHEREALYMPGVSDGTGTFKVPLPEPLSGGESNNRRAEAFAWMEGNRYAVTNSSDFSGYYIPDGERANHAFVSTDRSLYRPDQPVNFRVVMAQGVAGSYTPAANRPANLVVNGPRGELLNKQITFNKFGAYNDQLKLPPAADLGNYSITIRGPLPPQYFAYGQVQFRVEEYKKPEFTVNVTPEKSQVRVGEKLNVSISARYFFGAPVAGAKVHYRVFRAPYVYPMPFRPRLSWYDQSSNYSGRGSYYNSEYAAYWGNANVAYREGDAVTDATGTAKIAFPTLPPRRPKRGAVFPLDQSFTVSAEVTDDARRQVSGVGTAKAAETQFKAFLTTDRRFVLSGESYKADIRTVDVNGGAIAVKGSVTMKRLIPEIPEEKAIDPKTGKEYIKVYHVPAREEKVDQFGVETDAEGKGVVVWRADTPGNYRLDFEARDAWGHAIATNCFALVYGPAYDSLRDRIQNNFLLLPEYSEYHVGDTARVLLIAPYENCYALFLEHSVGSIRRYRTIFIPGRSTIVNVPITADRIPNVYFSATIAHGGMVQEAQAEVGVPAEGKILNLKVTPDKPVYRPGEQATFKILALDAEGKPASGEVTLSVVDEALIAMQADLVPDIRRFFYGSRIQTYLGSNYSASYYSSGYAVAPPVAAYERHPLVYPEGMGWIRDHERQQESVPYFAAYYEYNQGGFGSGGFGGGGGFGMNGAMGGAYRNIDSLSGPQGEAGDSAMSGMSEAHTLNSSRRTDRDAKALFAEKDKSESSVLGMEDYSGALATAAVRRLFADTAFWAPAVTTDADGIASVTFTFPDNITQWHVTARGVTEDVKVGVTETQVVTKKNLLVRLQSPRFFVDHDQVTLSANIHNCLDSAKRVRVELVTDSGSLTLAAGKAGVQVSGTSGVPENGKKPDHKKQGPKTAPAAEPIENTAVREIQVGKDGEARVDWVVDARRAGKTRIKVVAQTDAESDAAEMEFPVLVHGIEKFVAESGVLHDGGEATLTLDVPEQRRKGDTLLDVQMQPSLAGIMVDSLPYLEDYPYGCIEQTLSRFVPTILVAKSLRNAGIDLEALGKRAQALEEQRKNIPPQKQYENSGYTYPKGIPGALDSAALASRIGYPTGRRSHAPIFNSGVLNNMVDEGLQSLYRKQRADGSWAWWQGSPLGDTYLTAYVLEGLLQARQADVPVRQEVIDRGFSYLFVQVATTEDLHLLAYLTYVISLKQAPGAGPQAAAFSPSRAHLYERRDRLNAYGQALLALAMHNSGENEQAQVLLRNLVNTAKTDKERGTVHWETDDRAYWHWYNDKQETTAMVLRALVAIAPDQQLAPVNGPQAAQTGLAPMAVRWLVDNRRAGFWTSTRQTAHVVEALLEYARSQKELAPDYTVTIDLDGKVSRSFHIDKENALLFDNRFLVGDEVMTSGTQKLHITMQGKGTLYYSSYLKYFDMSDPIKAQANAIAVERKYYKIVPIRKPDKTGQVTTTFDRVPLSDGAQLTSGDIIEVELYLKSDNDYDYVVFEDMKPAGCEATETRSGTAYGDGVITNMELRDEKVAFFADRLPQGTRRITYRLRAEVPGVFHALPTNAYAMYAPDIRATSDEWRVSITDAPKGK